MRQGDATSRLASLDEGSTFAFPQCREDVTPHCIEAALRGRFPDARVDSVDIVDEMLGAAVKLRLECAMKESAGPEGPPRHMILKAHFNRLDPGLDFMFHDEVRAYRDVVGRLSVNAPACYFAGSQGRSTLLLLEDMRERGARFGAVMRPYGFAEAAAILDQLAALHAAFWDSPHIRDGGDLAWAQLSVTGPHLAYMRAMLKPDVWDSYRQMPRAAGCPHALASDPIRIERAILTQFASHGDGPRTLGHGDAHVANSFLDATGGGFFDWQMRRCPWYHDVTFFIVSCLDIADRRAWESDLLRHYLSRLAAHGVEPPSFDAAFHAYRREVIFGYVIFFSNSDWPEAPNTAATARFAMAAEDLGTIAAIEAD
ncbi:MAG: phosphotransferase [Sphingobium sp.]